MRRARLSLEPLEGREVPAQFGIPWANGTGLTVSFAPDGADVDGAPSELHALMARSGLSEADWQQAVLRAFQAWAAQADLNVGVVADDGSPLGAPGLEQGHGGFGDIRVFAAPLDPGVLAITTPPGDLGGTRTGDIILNSRYTFGTGSGSDPDLYTVFLQEAGHALGVGNSPNPLSVMYEFYDGARAGLCGEDVGKVRDLYGPPSGAWEPAGGNDSRETATPLAGTDTRVTFGDLSSAADADWYSFTATDPAATVRLQVAGLSLLAGRLAVFNAAGGRVGFATAAGPGEDLVVGVSRLNPGARYFVRADEVVGTPFATGRYRLTVGPAAGGPETVTLAGEPPADDDRTNESFATATRLTDPEGRGLAYRAFGWLRPADVDVYRVRAPFPGMNQTNLLTATVRAFGDLAPKVTVTNWLGLNVPFRLVADGRGVYTVVATAGMANADYHVTVESRSGAAGAYELRAEFRSVVTTAYAVENGLLTALDPTVVGHLEVTGSAQIYFLLSCTPTQVVGPSVVVRVYDAAGQVRFQLLARAGETVDGVALLGPGRYRVEVTGNGSFLPHLVSGFSLALALLTDPVGVPPSDPNQSSGGDEESPPPPPPSGYNYYNDSGYYVWGEQTPSGES